MKYFHTIIAVIIGLALFLGWRDHREFAAEMTNRSRLHATARELGIDPHQVSPHFRNRTDRDMDRITSERAAAAKIFVDRLTVAIGDYQAGVENAVWGIHKLIDRAEELDGAEFRAAALAIRDCTGFDDHMRALALSDLLGHKALDSPREVLALFGEVVPKLKDHDNGSAIIGCALMALAAEDLEDALAWVRDNEKNYPDSVDQYARISLLGEAARKDPKLAFQLLSDYGIEDLGLAIGQMSESVSTADERQGLLGALRDYVGNADPSQRAALLESGLGSLGEKMNNDGFDKSAEWLNAADLSPEEKAAVAGGLTGVRDDTGKWTDWVIANVPLEKASKTVAAMIENWAVRDYNAAAEWLNQADPGPVRDEAVSHYAKAIAPVEPVAAAGWAESLPVGKSRDEALQGVYSGWMKKDPAAARDFASKHGLKH